MTFEEFMKHAADAAYMGDADLLEGHARELFGELERITRERDIAIEEAARLRGLHAEAVETITHFYRVCDCLSTASQTTIDAMNAQADAVVQKAKSAQALANREEKGK